MRSKDPHTADKIREFIDQYYRENRGGFPSLRVIEKAVGVSRQTVQRYLTAMRENGELEYDGSSGVRTPEMLEMDPARFVRMPVIGEIACGTPAYAEENVEDYVRLPVSLVGHGEFFLLRAKGDSMINVGIDSGDVVLVRKQDYAQRGQIVVALVGDDTTLKRYYPEPEHRRIRLHPENDALDDIYVDDCLIQGVAVKVLKDLS